jgi:hypothetical protein
MNFGFVSEGGRGMVFWVSSEILGVGFDGAEGWPRVTDRLPKNMSKYKYGLIR